MNKEILNKYGISLVKQVNGNVKVTAESPLLNIYIYSVKTKIAYKDF